MFYLIRIGIKNTFRKAKRSIITACSVFIGVAIMIFAWSFLDGLEMAAIRGQIASDTGHFRIMDKNFLDREDDMELAPAIKNSNEIIAHLQKHYKEVSIFPRMTFPSELSNGVHSLQVKGVGIDPATYFQKFELNLKQKLNLPKIMGNASDFPPIWIGSGIATPLNAKIGDTFTILTKTFFGNYTAIECIVSGIFESKNAALDNLVFFIPIDTARTLLDLTDGTTEIVGFLENKDQINTYKKNIMESLNDKGIEFQTWIERVGPILKINELRRKILNVIMGLIMLVSATGIANTMIMSAFERIKEVGTLRAIGFQPEQIVIIFLSEAFIIGLIGSIAGVLMGSYLVDLYRDGMDLSSFFENGQVNVSMSTVLYFEWRIERVVGAFLIGMGISLLASLYPSIKFSSLNPLTAMKR